MDDSAWFIFYLWNDYFCSCACDPEKGTCKPGEDATLPQSVAAGYHCECAQSLNGFLCDTLACTDSQYLKGMLEYFPKRLFTISCEEAK